MRRPADLLALAIEAAGASWYPLLLVAGTLAVDGQPPDLREGIYDALSTNLHNLDVHPIRSLVGSGLVSDGHLLAWCVLAFVGLLVAGRRLGAMTTAALVVGVHVGATLISQAVVWQQIRAGRLGESARLMRDLGPSYLVVAALIAGLVVGRRWSRLPAGLGFAVLAPSLFGGLPHLEVSSVGHLASVVLAAAAAPLIAWWQSRRARRRDGVDRVAAEPVRRTADAAG